MTQPDLSIVLGSLNRRRLLSHAINSVRANGFTGSIEIIVVDGGSRDGTCEWLAKQADILTIIQPNRKISLPDGRRRRLHSWANS